MRLLLVIIICLVHVEFSAQEVVNGSIMHDGLERGYILYIPDSYEEGNPLVMNFHGYGSNAFEQMFYGDFQAIANEVGFMLVHPDGTEDLIGNTHWNVGWGTSTVDDVSFASALIDSLHASYSIDLERIYSTGMSNGGFFSYKLACELSERIAAIASVTGAMTSGAFNTCDAQHPMPVMQIHGTADPTVAFDGTPLFEGVEDIIDYWVDFNEIIDVGVVTAVPDTDPDDGCTAEHWLYENSNNGVDVELYKIIDGAHTWPGASFNIGVTNQDFDASETIWEFFSRYDINGEIEATGVEDLIAKPELTLWPNPAEDFLRIGGIESTIYYSIVNDLGQSMLNGQISKGANTIQVNDLSAGIYQLDLADGRTVSFIIK